MSTLPHFPSRRGRAGLRKLALVTVSFVGAAGSAQATDGYFEHGYGIQEKGLGGAGIAFPLDAVGIASNPAAATELGDRADFDLELFRPDRSASIDGNLAGPNASYSGNGQKNFGIPEGGVTYQLNPDWAAGLAIYGNGGMNTSYQANPYGRFGASGTAGVNLEQAIISPTLAYRFSAHQSVGLSLNIAYQLFKARGIGIFGGFSNNPAAVSDNKTDTSVGAGVHLGYLGRVTPWLALGGEWQSKTYMDSFKKYSGLFADSGSFDLPSTVGIGADVTLQPGLDLALDLQRIFYSDVDAVGDPLQSLFTGTKLGASGGPGFGWRDTNTLKLGINWRVDPAWQLRAGYNHSTQPIPSDQTFFNILAPATIQNQFTVGATWDTTPRWQISVYGLYALPQTVSGTANSVPLAFGGGTANIKLSETAVGLGIGYKY